MYATFSARWQRRYSLELWLRQTKPDASSDALKLLHTSVRLSVTGIESLWISTLDSSGVSLDDGTGVALEDDGTTGIEDDEDDDSTGTGLEDDCTGPELDDDGTTGIEDEDSTGTELDDELGPWLQGFSSVHSITGATQTVPLAHSRIVQTFSGEWHWMYSGLVLLMHRKPLASGSGSYSSQILRMVSSVSEDDSDTGTELEDTGTVLDDEVTGTDDEDDDDSTGTELEEDCTGTELDEEETTGIEDEDENTGTELDDSTGTELEDDSTGTELDDEVTGTELEDSTGTELDDDEDEEPWLQGFSSVHSITGATQ